MSDAVCTALGNGLGSEINGQRSRTPFTCTHWLAWYLFSTAQVCLSFKSEEKVTLQVYIPIEKTLMKSQQCFLTYNWLQVKRQAAYYCLSPS